jgi:hypothetical protein
VIPWCAAIFVIFYGLYIMKNRVEEPVLQEIPPEDFTDGN